VEIETVTGRTTATLPLSLSIPQVTAVAFSPDGTTLAAGDQNGTSTYGASAGSAADRHSGPRRAAPRLREPGGHLGASCSHQASVG
jgi:hypothetical protein